MGSNACLGGNLTNDESCAPGYLGPLCNLCDVGLYFDTSSNTCQHCASSGSVGLLFVPFSIVVVAILWYFLKGFEKLYETINKYEAQTKAKIIVVLFQVNQTPIHF